MTIFVSGTFGLFDVMCKLHHRTALNPFLKGTKKVTLTVSVNKAFYLVDVETVCAGCDV